MRSPRMATASAWGSRGSPVSTRPTRTRSACNETGSIRRGQWLRFLELHLGAAAGRRTATRLVAQDLGPTGIADIPLSELGHKRLLHFTNCKTGSVRAAASRPCSDGQKIHNLLISLSFVAV